MASMKPGFRALMSNGPSFTDVKSNHPPLSAVVVVIIVPPITSMAAPGIGRLRSSTTTPPTS